MYDRKKLIILRAVLIVIGAAVGGTALWQYFAVYPDLVRREIQIVIVVVSAAAAAALLGLSAKPFYRLGASIGSQYLKLFSGLGFKGVIAVVTGLFTACMVAYVFDMAIRSSLDILAVRVLADLLVGIIMAAVCCYGFSRWLASSESDEPAPDKPRGYLLTASCFYDDRVFTAASVLIGAAVDGSTAKALWKFGTADSAAIERFKATVDSGFVKVIGGETEYDTPEEYLAAMSALASSKRLMPLYVSSELYPDPERATSLDVFAYPSDDIKKLFVRQNPQAAENGGDKDDDKDGDDADAHGQIIIDK